MQSSYRCNLELQYYFFHSLDYLVELHQLHPIFTLWAASEPELAKALQAIASAIESNAAAHQKLLDTTVNEEREYVTYVDAVKDALNRRDAMQSEYELTVEELTKRETEREQVRKIKILFSNNILVILMIKIELT